MINSEKKINISIDLMGGDNSPEKTIEGIDLFIKRYKNKNDYFFYLFGDSDIALPKIKKLKYLKSDYFKLVDTKIVVSNELSPIAALKKGKDSSMWKSIESQLSLNTDVTLSAGNTGVFLVMSKMILKMLEGIDRPALAGLWPSNNGMNLVLDLGANVECSDKNLIDFSEMGSALYKSLFPQNEVKLSLLNIGSEELKGTEILKKAYSKLQMLESMGDFKFVGYVEGNQIMSDRSNVIVTDGFTGNVALKTAEGVSNFLTKNLKKYLTENIFSKLSLIFSYFSLKKFKNKLDPRKYNGAIFLGLKGPVVKSHGGIDALGFSYSIELCYKIGKGRLSDKIKKNLEHVKDLDDKKQYN